jgi:hypothetical protein
MAINAFAGSITTQTGTLGVAVSGTIENCGYVGNQPTSVQNLGSAITAAAENLAATNYPGVTFTEANYDASNATVTCNSANVPVDISQVENNQTQTQSQD